MYCVDVLKHNLLCISQICDRDHVVNFSTQGCEISTKNDKIIARCLRTNDNCYFVENTCAASFSSCHMAQVDEAQLWPSTTWTVNYWDLSCLSVRGHIKGLPKISQKAKSICGECQISKLFVVTQLFSIFFYEFEYLVLW